MAKTATHSRAVLLQIIIEDMTVSAAQDFIREQNQSFDNEQVPGTFVHLPVTDI
jgi:hypothetical protein